MNTLSIIFAVVVVILTIVLTIVGIQVIMVLTELRSTLRKLNTTLEVVEEKVHLISSPFENLGGTLAGIKTGMQFFEAFTTWLSKKNAKKNCEVE